MKWPKEHKIEEEKIRNEGKIRRKREEKRTTVRLETLKSTKSW
jgi:hypothetical protein